MRTLSPLAAASSIALGLAACGTSTSTSHHAKASASSGAYDASARGSPGACRTVSAPVPKGAQHLPPPARWLDPARRYVVALATNCGTIAIQLDVKAAPRTS
jgi:hypothetical protein